MQPATNPSSLTRFLGAQLRLGRSRDIWFFALLLSTTLSMFVAYIARLHPITHDAFHEMAMIRYWMQSGEFPYRDVFAFTPTVSPAVHHEWATGLFLYFATSISDEGFIGIALLKWLMIGLLGLMLYRVGRQAGGHPLIIAIMAPIAFPLLWVGFATVRAGLFTLVAIAAQLLMQQSDLRGRKVWIAYWIPLYLVWLNVHAGFVVGVAMLGLHGIERLLLIAHERYPRPLGQSLKSWLVGIPFGDYLTNCWIKVWHLVLLIPVMILGLLCNPWGADYFPYLVRAISMPRPTMLEWRPLWHTTDPERTLFCFGISIALLLYAIRHRRVTRWTGLLISLFAAYMAMKHIRHGAIYGVLWIGLVPAWLTPTPLGRWIVKRLEEHRRPILRFASLVSLLCLGFSISHRFYTVSLPASNDDSPHCYPVHAVDFLNRKGFQGNLFTPFHAGSFVSWKLFPSTKVSIDGRYEVAYREDVLPDHNCFYRGDSNWAEILKKYPCDAILIPVGSPVRKRIDEAIEMADRESDTLCDWEIVYQDNAYLIAAKRAGG